MKAFLDFITVVLICFSILLTIVNIEQHKRDHIAHNTINVQQNMKLNKTLHLNYDF